MKACLSRLGRESDCAENPKAIRGQPQSSKDQKAVRSAVEAWLHEAIRADWKSPADVLKAYANASIVGPDRVVFNIKGNDYRLVVASTIVTRSCSSNGSERMGITTRLT